MVCEAVTPWEACVPGAAVCCGVALAAACATNCDASNRFEVPAFLGNPDAAADMALVLAVVDG